MNEENIRRRRRTRATSTTEPSFYTAPLQATEPSEVNLKIAPEPIITDFSLSKSDWSQINQIRAEFDVEQSKSELISEYSDDTHNWFDDGENFSNDYWHFLGRFE
jgi:long-subunit fatty acid transport protein